MSNNTIQRHTVRIVSAYVSRNPVTSGELQELIQSVMSTLSNLGQQPSQVDDVAPGKPSPSLPIRKSVTADTITCLFCGKRGSALRKHLSAAHQMEPNQYRAYWGLPLDYPMTAPNFSARRSEIAHAIGLGTGTKRGKGTRPGS